LNPHETKPQENANSSQLNVERCLLFYTNRNITSSSCFSGNSFSVMFPCSERLLSSKQAHQCWKLFLMSWQKLKRIS